MHPKEIKNKRILISPLNWGMGHVSRLIPLIRQLLNQDNKVWIACDDNQKAIFSCYFKESEVIFLRHEGYPFQFRGKGFFVLDLLRTSIRLSESKKKEKIQVERWVNDYGIELILSDHRYGFYSDNCPSYFLTHQLQLPLKWWWKFAQLMHDWQLSKFDQIWVYDNQDSLFAGKLSFNYNWKNVQYIGVFSRFQLYENENKTIPIVVVISGPEPYAEHFFREQLKRLTNEKECIFVIPRKYNDLQIPKNFDVVISDDWLKVDRLLLKAQKIVSRSGYSTIMDLHYLQAEGTLFPTKGQGEQQYLTKLHVKYVV